MSSYTEPDYDDEPTKRRSTFLGTGTTSRSYEMESWTYVQHKEFKVHILQETDKKCKNRPIIPANTAERLTFLRAYVTATNKTQVIYVQQMEFSSFLWLYVWNVIFRNVPTNYIHLFLASYSPRDHLFGSKMIPCCYGVSWQVVLCALFQLVHAADTVCMFGSYAFGWFVKESMYKCNSLYYKLPPHTFPYRCYSVEEFFNISHTYNVQAEGGDISLYRNFYRWNIGPKVLEDTYFTIAPLHRFMKVWTHTSVMEYKSYYNILIFALFWIAAGASYKLLFKKYIWKIFYRLHMTVIGIYVVVMLYITWFYLDEENIEQIKKTFSPKNFNLATKWDFVFLSDTIAAPPIVHVLYSRCKQDVSPGRDSFLITVSNSGMYFLQSLVDFYMKDYVESKYRAPITMSEMYPYSIFYYWPFFLEFFSLGDIVMRIIFCIMFLVHLLVFILTYQMLIEVMVYEWKYTNRLVASALISCVGLAMSIFIKGYDKEYLYMFTTSITSLTEAIVICWIYPMERLCDDVHFMNGISIHFWRKWSLRLLPWYHIYKTYRLFSAFDVLSAGAKGRQIPEGGKYIMIDSTKLPWIWVLAVIPLPLGLLYAIFKHIYMEKLKWRMLLKPRPDWGPVKNMTRHVRKQFDSREYVTSRAPRYLSRYLLARAKTATYRLDVRYTRLHDVSH